MFPPKKNYLSHIVWIHVIGDSPGQQNTTYSYTPEASPCGTWTLQTIKFACNVRFCILPELWLRFVHVIPLLGSSRQANHGPFWLRRALLRKVDNSANALKEELMWIMFASNCVTARAWWWKNNGQFVLFYCLASVFPARTTKVLSCYHSNTCTRTTIFWLSPLFLLSCSACHPSFYCHAVPARAFPLSQPSCVALLIPMGTSSILHLLAPVVSEPVISGDATCSPVSAVDFVFLPDNFTPWDTAGPFIWMNQCMKPPRSISNGIQVIPQFLNVYANTFISKQNDYCILNKYIIRKWTEENIVQKKGARGNAIKFFQKFCLHIWCMHFRQDFFVAYCKLQKDKMTGSFWSNETGSVLPLLFFLEVHPAHILCVYCPFQLCTLLFRFPIRQAIFNRPGRDFRNAHWHMQTNAYSHHDTRIRRQQW